MNPRRNAASLQRTLQKQNYSTPLPKSDKHHETEAKEAPADPQLSSGESDSLQISIHVMKLLVENITAHSQSRDGCWQGRESNPTPACSVALDQTAGGTGARRAPAQPETGPSPHQGAQHKAPTHLGVQQSAAYQQEAASPCWIYTDSRNRVPVIQRTSTLQR